MSQSIASSDIQVALPPRRRKRRKADAAPEVPRHWTVRQLMAHLDCTRSAIDAQVRKGNLRIKKHGHWSLISEPEVRRFLRKVVVIKHKSRVILLYED